MTFPVAPHTQPSHAALSSPGHSLRPKCERSSFAAFFGVGAQYTSRPSFAPASLTTL